MRKLLLLLVSVLPVGAANIRYEVTGLLGGKLDFIASDFITNLPPTEIKPEIFTIWELPDSALLSSPCRSFRGDRACTSLSFYLDFTGGGESAVVEWKWFDQIDHIEKVGDNVRIFDIDFSQLGQWGDRNEPFRGRGLTISSTDAPATYGATPEPATFLLTLPAFAGLWLWRKSRNGWKAN